MKKQMTVIAVAALLLVTESMPAQSVLTSIGTTVAQFFANNPQNSWDVSGYGLNNVAQSQLDISKGWGGGARVGYWLNPSVGASLDLSYCNSSWTFASIGLAGRGTITFGTLGTISPYITAGPGLNIKSAANGATPTVVVVAGGGATIHVNAIKWCDFFGEYRHVTTTEPQDLIAFGITKHF